MFVSSRSFFHLEDLGVPLLVELNLSCSSHAGFVQPVCQLLVFSAQIRSLPFCLCSALSLRFKLFLHLLNSRLKLLDLPLSAANTTLLIVQLAHHVAQISLLSQNAALQFFLCSFKIQN